MSGKVNDPAAVATLFHAAAVGASDWSEALSALTALTGAFTGELLGFGRADALSFYCSNAIGPDLHEEMKAARGYDPSVNSRVRVGLGARPLEIFDERHFTTAADMRRNPEYGDVLRKVDGHNLCLTSLLCEDGMTVGLSALRTAGQGPMSDEETRAFAAVSAHARSAVRLYMDLEIRDASRVADALERVSACVFLCGADACIHAMSATAETLLRDGRWLGTRGGVLVAKTVPETQRLHRAIHAAVDANAFDRAPPPPFSLDDGAGGRLPLEAMPYVAERTVRVRAMAIVVARPPRDLGGPAAGVGRLVFHLSDRESAIVAHLARGHGVSDIARIMAISVATVRVHLRNIFEKVGVHSQSELIARLCSYF